MEAIVIRSFYLGYPQLTWATLSRHPFLLG